MLPLLSHGANLFNLCPLPNSSSLYVQNWFPIVPAAWPHFPVFWIVDPIKPPKMPPWGIVVRIVLAYVHSHMNPQRCTKCGANRSSLLRASPDFSICDPLTPPPPDMPPGVLRGDLYLAIAHSQMNPQTRTKVGANRSSRLTAYPDLWMFNPLNPPPPPSAPLCLSGQFVWRISIPIWIYTYVPNLVPIGPAIWIFPWLLNLWPPNPPNV